MDPEKGVQLPAQISLEVKVFKDGEKPVEGQLPRAN